MFIFSIENENWEWKWCLGPSIISLLNYFFDIWMVWNVQWKWNGEIIAKIFHKLNLFVIIVFCSRTLLQNFSYSFMGLYQHQTTILPRHVPLLLALFSLKKNIFYLSFLFSDLKKSQLIRAENTTHETKQAKELSRIINCLILIRRPSPRLIYNHKQLELVHLEKSILKQKSYTCKLISSH